MLKRVLRKLTGSGSAPGPGEGPGSLEFGHLRRLEPISRNWGYDRGLPIDRYYIEGFLERNATAIRGRVLEIGDDGYTRRFGSARVTKRDILHVSRNCAEATIISDLARGDDIPSDAFDCIILTQTLHLIYDVRSAIETLHRILKPCGVLLATFPGISKIDRYEWSSSWFWAFTSRSAARLFEEKFPGARIETFGNVLAAISFLHGLATEELKKEELDYRDEDFELVIAVRAEKPKTG